MNVSGLKGRSAIYGLGIPVSCSKVKLPRESLSLLVLFPYIIAYMEMTERDLKLFGFSICLMESTVARMEVKSMISRNS